MTTGRSRNGPTILEVAQVARVSRQTVSNALNSPDRVRPETLARVLDVIDELGYVPNRMARSLRTRSTRQIGYRLDPGGIGAMGVLQDAFLQALTRAAEDEGYLMMLFSSGRTSDEFGRYEEMLCSGVDGFVLSGMRPGDRRPERLARRQTPFVSFGRPRPAAPDYLWVDVDGAAGAEAVVDHLAAAGHRRIGFLGWSSPLGPGRQRLIGWCRAMDRHGLDSGHRRYTDGTLGSSARAAQDLLEQVPSLTAVVCAGDTLAMGCYSAACRTGRVIGRDLAVTGFDDSPAAAMVSPALTSVRQPVEDIAGTIMRLLAARLRGQQPSPGGVLLTPSLIVRGSA